MQWMLQQTLEAHMIETEQRVQRAVAATAAQAQQAAAATLAAQTTPANPDSTGRRLTALVDAKAFLSMEKF